MENKNMNTNIIKFLCGESDFCGLWYGDKHPTEAGQFWWRKHLRSEMEAIQTANTILEGALKYQREKSESLSALLEAADEVKESLNDLVSFSEIWGREWFNDEDWKKIDRAREVNKKYFSLKEKMK